MPRKFQLNRKKIVTEKDCKVKPGKYMKHFQSNPNLTVTRTICSQIVRKCV